MIAALYVEANGAYSGLQDIDLWPETRDARNYAGPWPVVAHPPCSTWCKMAPVNQARYGIPIGSDDGCFAAALAAVHRWGGVLEHPAYSLAWLEHRLPWPQAGGWQRDLEGGWCCYVEQGNYGHPARKPTWLYAVSDRPLPTLRWGQATHSGAWISADRPRAVLKAMGIARQLSSKEASATPLEFRDVLIGIAATALDS